MFIGRERELSYLNEFYEKPGIGMTIIYGRRRVGKSTLIAEFVKKKNYFLHSDQGRKRAESGAVFQTGNRTFFPGDREYYL